MEVREEPSLMNFDSNDRIEGLYIPGALSDFELLNGHEYFHTDYEYLAAKKWPFYFLHRGRFFWAFTLQIMSHIWNRFFFAALKQYSGSCSMSLFTTICKSEEEENRELAKCLHMALFYSGIGIFLIYVYGIYIWYRPIRKFGYWKRKNSIGTSLNLHHHTI